MTSTLPQGTLGSVASLLEILIGSKLWNIITTERYILHMQVLLDFFYISRACMAHLVFYTRLCSSKFETNEKSFFIPISIAKQFSVKPARLDFRPTQRMKVAIQ